MLDTVIRAPVENLVRCIDDALNCWFPGDTDGFSMDKIRVSMWPQTFPSTALGFLGVSDNAVTQTMTVVLRRYDEHPEVRVYHGGILAYQVFRPTQHFEDAVLNQKLPGQAVFVLDRSVWDSRGTPY